MYNCEVSSDHTTINEKKQAKLLLGFIFFYPNIYKILSFQHISPITFQMLWGHGWLMAIAPLESVLWLCYLYFSKSHDNMFSQVLTFPGRSVNWIFYIRYVLPGPLNFAYCLPDICRHVSLFLIYNLFMYFWLCWVFIAVQAFPLVVVRGLLIVMVSITIAEHGL